VNIPLREEGADSNIAIEARNLTRRFGDFVSVDHVCFPIGLGEIFGFLGSNGCARHLWQIMIDLARRGKVTIFISTHFMNEAERCDRISLMHAGRVLVSDNS
jgi:ABC-type multidrug transport system ATPase subunit